jgi:hypothetical protein
LAAALAGEIEPARLIFSPADFWEEVRRWWPVRLLQQAASEKDAEAYKKLLHYWLICLCDEQPPKGVLTPWRGKPGRPRQKESEEVVLTWIKIGRPSLSRQNLARTFYGEAFTKADTAGKKKMIDRCQKAARISSLISPQSNCAAWERAAARPTPATSEPAAPWYRHLSNPSRHVPHPGKPPSQPSPS